MKRISKINYYLIGALILISSCNSNYDCTNYSEDVLIYDHQALDYQEKGALLHFYDKPDSALHYFELAIQQDPTYYLPHANKGKIHIQRNSFSVAQAEWEMVTQLNPEMPVGHLSLGMLYDYLDKDEKAAIEYNKSINIYTSIIECSIDQEKIQASRISRATIYMLNGEQVKGIEELEDLKLNFKDDIDMLKLIDNTINIQKDKFVEDMLFLDYL